MTNTTASIGLAQLDNWISEAIRLFGSAMKEMHWPALERHLKEMQKTGNDILARRSLTSGAPAEPAPFDVTALTRYAPDRSGMNMEACHDGAYVLLSDVQDAAYNTAPVHDAAAPSAEISKQEAYTLRRLIECAEALDKRPRPMCRDCGDENGTCPNGDKLECDMPKLFANAKALHNRLVSAGAAAKTEHALCGSCKGSGQDGDCGPDGTPVIVPCGECGGSGQASAAGAGSDKVPGDVCAEMRALCSSCGGTGDVHSIDGEWRGECNCPEGISLTLERLKIAAKRTQGENDELRAELARFKGASVTVQDERAPSVQPKLTVWYGPMPESNGKSNFTAVLMRKDSMWDRPHVTIERGEYPDRIRYEADRVRYLIGELTEEPFILDYDADKHSGYVEPDRTAHPVQDGEKDAERLDFLDTNVNRFRMGWEVGAAPVGNLSVRSIIMGGKMIREAIDAAMAADRGDQS